MWEGAGWVNTQQEGLREGWERRRCTARRAPVRLYHCVYCRLNGVDLLVWWKYIRGFTRPSGQAEVSPPLLPLLAVLSPSAEPDQRGQVPGDTADAHAGAAVQDAGAGAQGGEAGGERDRAEKDKQVNQGRVRGQAPIWERRGTGRGKHVKGGACRYPPGGTYHPVGVQEGETGAGEAQKGESRRGQMPREMP